MVETLVYIFGSLTTAFFALGAIAIIVAGIRQQPGRSLALLMLLITASSIVGVALSNRVMTVGIQGLNLDVDPDGGGNLFSKLLLVGALFFSISSCLFFLFRLSNKKTISNRFSSRGLEHPNDITISFIAFYAAFSLLPIYFGQKYFFKWSLVYPLFIYIALFLLARISITDPIIITKRCLALIVFGSLIAAVASPSLAFQPGYSGLVPGYSFRLWGVTSHANSLGAVASLLLVLELAEPSKRRILRYTMYFGAGLAMILSQSKTSLIGAMVGILIIYLYRFLRSPKKLISLSLNNIRIAQLSILLALITTITTSCIAFMFLDFNFTSSILKNLDQRALSSLATGTGRTFIWSAAINGGLENPLFGQGADFWNLENRLRLGIVGATHAHNLFLQVFSISGLFGLATLLVFVYFLFKYSIRACHSTSGASIALLAMFFMRAMTEVPIAPNSILSAEFFVSITFFLYVIDRGSISKNL